MKNSLISNQFNSNQTIQIYNNLSHPKRKLKSASFTRPVRRALRFRKLYRPRRRSTTFSNPSSRNINQVKEEDEETETETESESEDEDEEHDEWIKSRWNALLDRQRLIEADVRRIILTRNRLDPLELSQWLDSEDTCTLPLPNLGVQLRMHHQ